MLKNASPVYKEMPGWDMAIRKIRRYKDLPKEAKDYLDYLKDLLGTKISMISLGSALEETIKILD